MNISDISMYYNLNKDVPGYVKPTPKVQEPPATITPHPILQYEPAAFHYYMDYNVQLE